MCANCRAWSNSPPAEMNSLYELVGSSTLIPGLLTEPDEVEDSQSFIIASTFFVSALIGAKLFCSPTQLKIPTSHWSLHTPHCPLLYPSLLNQVLNHPPPVSRPTNLCSSAVMRPGCPFSAKSIFSEFSSVEPNPLHLVPPPEWADLVCTSQLSFLVLSWALIATLLHSNAAPPQAPNTPLGYDLEPLSWTPFGAAPTPSPGLERESSELSTATDLGPWKSLGSSGPPLKRTPTKPIKAK